jgi:hypothetical protein
MIFERQGAPAISNPSEAVLKRELRKLKAYGKSSFVSLTDDFGNYVQVGGGGVTCLLERHEGISAKHFRARLKAPVVPPEFDGALLCFSGNEISLRRNEWFQIERVVEIFLAFRSGRLFEEAGIEWIELEPSFLLSSRKE